MVRLSFGDKRESSCSCNTLKLARMMVPIAGNASDFSELLPKRFGSKESAVSILYTTINSVCVDAVALCNSMKLVRMIGPITGNASELSELVSEHSRSEVSPRLEQFV